MSWLRWIAELGLNINPYVQGLFRARGEAAKFGKDVGSELKNSLAGAFGTGAVLGFAKKTVDHLGGLSDAALRLDTTTTKLQEWYFAATQAGGAAQDVVKFFEAINSAQNDALNGKQEALDSFQRLGVTLRDLQTLRTDELGRKIANSIKSGDVQKLLNDLADVGGKAAKALIPAFKQGIDEASAAAHELGQVIDDATINRVDQLGDRLAQITTTLMGPMSTLLGWVNSAVSKIAQTFQLLGAYSVKFNFKKMRFEQSFGEFLSSQEAQDIVKNAEAADAAAINKNVPNEIRKFMPKGKKEKFDNDLLGKAVGRLNADNLASVGGFVGRAANVNPIVDLAKQQLLEQKKIAQNTDPARKGNTDKFSYQ